MAAGGPWREPCQWLSPPPQRLYSLCGVLVFRPIVPDVRGGCDSTDNERNPSTDEVEPAGEREATHCTLSPTGSPKDSAAFRVKVGVMARASWPSRRQSEAAPASNQRTTARAWPLLSPSPPPSLGLASPAVPHIFLLPSPHSQFGGCCTPAETAQARPQRHVFKRAMTWVSGLWVGAG